MNSDVVVFLQGRPVAAHAAAHAAAHTAAHIAPHIAAHVAAHIAQPIAKELLGDHIAKREQSERAVSYWGWIVSTPL
jgi:hypothetical protein